MRRQLKPIAVFLLLIAYSCPTMAAPAPQLGSSYGPLPVFEFHSGFWLNLHQTLYQTAKEKASGPSAKDRLSTPQQNPQLNLKNKTSGPALTATEQHAWDDALTYYTANFVGQDLLFSTDMILLKNELGDFDDCDELSGTRNKLCNAGLQPKLTQILEAAGAVYRAHQWPEDDRANRRWILRVAPLVREQGIGLSERLADIYQTHWPKAKIRVDVTNFAYSSGAYTTIEPLRVTISSTDPRNQDSAALEVLFHEASHGIAEPVEQAIIRECRQRGKPIPRDLWHALIFYTTGEVIRPVVEVPRAADATDALPPANSTEATQNSDNSMVLKAPAATNGDQRKSGYIPYALREGLYARGWEEYLALLTRFWQPYLEGQESYDDAIARMVSAL